MSDKDVRWETMDKSHIPLDKLMLEYEMANRVEGKSERTVEWYNQALRFLGEFLKERGHSCLLGDFDLQTVREYILYLQKRPLWRGHPQIPEQNATLARTSVDNHVRAIRAFFNWLHREGYTSEPLLAGLRPPRVPTKVVEPLNDVELAAIFSAMDPGNMAGARDVGIVTLLLDGGLRASELTGLKASDVHLEQGYVKVLGKGSKERIVPIGNTCKKSLMRYFFHFRPEPYHRAIDTFFLTLEGRAMTTNALLLILRRLGERSGVRRLHAHLLRHTFALNYLVNGGDVFSLQQILGHSTLEMVRRYVNLTAAHVLTQHQRFSPVDVMNLRQINRAVAMQGVRPRRRRAGINTRWQ